MNIKKFKFIKFIYSSNNYRHKKIHIYINPLIPFIMSIRKFKFIIHTFIHQNYYIYSSINSIYYGCKIYLPNNSYIYIYSYLLTLL